jgi:hypothetical protein
MDKLRQLQQAFVAAVPVDLIGHLLAEFMKCRFHKNFD